MTMRQGRHKWEILQDLSSGTGQGNVSIVTRRGDQEPTERMFQALARGVIKAIKTREDIETGRREFEKSMLDFIEHRYTLGALKQLKNPADEEAKARLRMEAALYERISDPHLVALLDVNLAEQEQWLVTEYQPNGTLENRLADFKGNALATLKAIRPVVNVLAKMHSEKFVHRDFKPGNIFIGRQSQFVLGDAGLAFYDSVARVSQTYENVGTREYMPAWAYGEQSEIKPAFDVFSVGKVIWAMIAGRPACRLWYVLKDDFNLSKIFADNSEMLWINELLSRCVLEEERDMKILNGTALLKEIDAAIYKIAVNATPPSEARMAGRTCRLCFSGTYQTDRRGHAGSVGDCCLRCDRCGHLQFFMDPPLKQ